MDGLQHEVQRKPGILKPEANLDGELLAALAPLFEAVTDSAFRVPLAWLTTNPGRIVHTAVHYAALRINRTIRPR